MLFEMERQAAYRARGTGILPRLEEWTAYIIKKALMKTDNRKAAGFAAALGEVRESLGEKDGKQHLLAKCREEFLQNVEEDIFTKKKSGLDERAIVFYFKQFGMKEDLQ